MCKNLLQKITPMKIELKQNYFFNILTQFIKDLTEYSNLSALLYFAYEIRS